MDALFSSVANLWKPDLEDYPLGWDLKKLSQLPSQKFWECCEMSDLFSLYRRTHGENPCFMILVHNKTPTKEAQKTLVGKDKVSSSETSTTNSKSVVGSDYSNQSLVIYSVVRFGLKPDALRCLQRMQHQFTLLFQFCPTLFRESNMKLLLEAHQKNPTYGPAHLLVHLGMNTPLTKDWINEYLQIPDENCVYPVHVACKEGRFDTIKELMMKGVSLEAVDNEGNNCLHFCAKTDKNLEILQLVLKKHPELMTKVNKEDMTALHVACLSDSIATVKLLVKSGHPLNKRSKNGFPLHLAMKNDSQQCVEYLCTEAPEQLNMTDPNSSQGELPLHMAKSNKAIQALIQHGSSTEAKNSMGKTPLHVMCDKRNLTCVLRLLACDANADAMDNEGNTPMHCAVLTHKSISRSKLRWVSKSDEIAVDLVRALLAFGADPNKRNSDGISVRHIVACQTKDSKLLRTLSDVGAVRCEHKKLNSHSPSTMYCTPGCSYNGDYNGELVNPEWIEPCLSGQIREYVAAFERHFRILASELGSSPESSPSPDYRRRKPRPKHQGASLHSSPSPHSSPEKHANHKTQAVLSKSQEGTSSERVTKHDHGFITINSSSPSQYDRKSASHSRSRSRSPEAHKHVSFSPQNRRKTVETTQRSRSPGSTQHGDRNRKHRRHASPDRARSEATTSRSVSPVHTEGARSRRSRHLSPGRRFSYATVHDKENFDSTNRRENILCLDGGGIRGLILLLCLRELQKHLKRPIAESFDWVTGTSTGGMVAMALLFGFSISKTMGIYFRFKDEVFQGMMRPYDHTVFEKLLKDYFTEDAVMTDIKHPKVLLSTVLGDRVPPDLFFFSNFHYPSTSVSKDLTHQGKFPPTDPPHKQLVYKAIRATSAAPTFFAPCGRMLDGGLMCNNPTLDVLTEVFRIHQSAFEVNGSHPPRIGCVVSCGTGFVAVEAKSLVVVKPSGIMEGIRSVSNLIQLTSTLIDQATVSEGRPVAQAQAWCQMCDVPYVRLNPPISSDVPMNETSDTALLKMCWEAQCFIKNNKNLFVKVARYINLSKGGRTRRGNHR